jgi:hypothetical protein
MNTTTFTVNNDIISAVYASHRGGTVDIGPGPGTVFPFISQPSNGMHCFWEFAGLPLILACMIALNMKDFGIMRT